jgi:nicotinate-nucleotide pyrophosphorylase (carboxylating)
MLDNMLGDELQANAKKLKEVYGKGGKGREFLIESSGGVVESGLLGRIGPGQSVLRRCHKETAS